MTFVSTRSPSHGSLIVLFVDDEPQACKWFARLFADEFSILCAGGVEEALAVLAERGDEIGVLVTDYRMPGENGLALLQAVQREHRHVVRLLATAYAEKEVALAAINQGRVLQIIEKPFDEKQVREVLREAMQVFRQREQERTLIDERAAAMRETLGFLAHELNTPLATVLGYMDALKSRLAVDGVGELANPSAFASVESAIGNAAAPQKLQRQPLQMVEAAERRTLYAMSLVATFVQSARDAYPGAATAPLQASRLVATLLESYPFEHDERDWVGADMAADFELPGQRDLLYLVLCTLTKNALMALRGTATPQLRITFENLSYGDAAVPAPAICFTDNGPGIAPDVLARLTYEPVTTRAAQGGSGMGLLFCRRVVQSMGGLIEIQSKPGEGTRVLLLFKPNIPFEKVNQ
jgi:two-component system, response regulator PhcR